MTRLEDWFEKVSKLLAEIGREPGLGLDDPAEITEAEQLDALHFPFALKIWRGRRTTVALLPTSDLPWRNWPVIIAKDGEALPLATDMRTALPRFLAMRLLSANPEGATRLAERWTETCAKAERLHSAMGGNQGQLMPVANTAMNTDRRAEITDSKSKNFEQSHSALARQIDGSAEFIEFADWLDDSISQKGRSDPSDIRHPWSSLALSWSGLIWDEDDSPETIPKLWPRLESYIGVGSGVPGEPTWALRPGAYSSAVVADMVAGLIARNSLASGQIESSIVRSLADEGLDYNGLAHAEAVPLADEAGEPERAWGVLNSAAWWMAQSKGEVPPAIFDGARLLCDRHGWDDIRWVLDHNASQVK